jgi:hypothetical protein
VARVLVKKGSHQVYNTISKSMEWLTMNCVVNATKGSLPRFYIFMGERIKDEYIKHCKARTCMGMQREAWMTIFYSNFSNHYSRGQFQVASQEVGLDMVTLPSHISHAL